jgi:integrase
MLALNTGMRYPETRLLQYKQVDFRTKLLTVGKSKTQSGTGRVIPLNLRILGVLQKPGCSRLEFHTPLLEA